MMTLAYLLAGAALACALIAYGGVRRGVYARGLLVAAGLYLVFACFAAQPGLWLLIEVLGVLAFGGMGWLGQRSSSWWLVAGWGLHPLWDMLLHARGPGAAFTPPGYAVACIAFDLLLAVYIAHAIVFQRLRPRRRRVAAES